MGFDKLYGNEPVKKSLIKALETGHISNSYVFEGIAGVGKRFCADIFAGALVCENNAGNGVGPCGVCSACVKAASKNHPDIIRLERMSGKTSVGVDEVREQILSEVFLKPYLARRRVFIIGDGDLLSVEAQNALLKVLEEPPEYVTFMICVTGQDNLLATVLSRSCVISFFPLSYEEVSGCLAERFGEGDRVRLSAGLAQGSIGAALNFMSDDRAEKLFEDSVEHMTELSRGAVKVREAADFMIEEKENIGQIIDFMLTFIRDCVFVKYGLEGRVIYDGKLSQMRVFTAGIEKKGLVSAFNRLIDLKLRLKQNLNFNASVSETVMRIWEDFHDKGSGHQI